MSLAREISFFIQFHQFHVRENLKFVKIRWSRHFDKLGTSFYVILKQTVLLYLKNSNFRKMKPVISDCGKRTLKSLPSNIFHLLGVGQFLPVDFEHFSAKIDFVLVFVMTHGWASANQNAGIFSVIRAAYRPKISREKKCEKNGTATLVVKWPTKYQLSH